MFFWGVEVDVVTFSEFVEGFGVGDGGVEISDEDVGMIFEDFECGLIVFDGGAFDASG